MFLSDERRDVFLPLAATEMSEEVVRKLEALGITTLEELRDTWTYGNGCNRSRYKEAIYPTHGPRR